MSPELNTPSRVVAGSSVALGLVIAGIFALSAWNSQAVDFNDPALEAAIRERAERVEGPLRRTDLLKITQLDVTERGVTDISGVDVLRRLETLTLDENEIHSLAPLSGMPRLTSLSVSGNPLGDLDDANVWALKQTNVRELRLRGIGMADPSSLAVLSGLTSLDLRDNSVRDISALGELTGLTHLNLRGNRVGDLTPVGQLNALEYLNIHSNHRVTGFRAVAELDNLRTLIARGVPIGADIQAIENMVRLERLNIRDAGVTDITPILSLIAQGALSEVAGDSAPTLDLRHNPALRLLNHDVLQGYDREQLASLQRRAGLLLPPVFSKVGGFHSGPFDLHITPPVAGAVWVTLDGSEPHATDNPDSTVILSSPLRVDVPSEGPHTLSVVGTRYPEHDPLRITEDTPRGMVVRARVADGSEISETTTHTYFVGEDVFERYGVLVASLVTDPDGLFDGTTGILVAGKVHDDMADLWRKNHADGLSWTRPGNFHQRGNVWLDLAGIQPSIDDEGLVTISFPDHGIDTTDNFRFSVPQVTIEGAGPLDGIHYLHPTSDANTLVIGLWDAGDLGVLPESALMSASWERIASMELFDRNGSQLLTHDIGLRVHGNSSRTDAQKSLRLYTRGSLGPSRFSAPLFPPAEDKQERLILRRTTQLNGFTDPLGQRLIQTLDPSMLIQRYASVALFLNGEFWGYYGLRDRYDTRFLSTTFNLPEESFVMVRGDGAFRGDTDLAQEFVDLRNAMSREDMSDPSEYATIASAIDLENFIDYMISGIFLNYSDWGARSHRLTWRVIDPLMEESPLLDGRWRWVPLDLDQLFVWGRPAEHNMLAEVLDARSYRLGDLLENPDFERAFLKRFRDALDGPFSVQESSMTADSLAFEAPNSLLADHARIYGGHADRNYVLSNTLDFLRRRGAIVDGHLAEHFGERWTSLR